MKQTAVEWFMDNIPTRFKNALLDMCKAEIEQAKEMEKQQIMTAFTQGDIFGADYFDGVNITEENYYNQTFNNESNYRI